MPNRDVPKVSEDQSEVTVGVSRARARNGFEALRDQNALTFLAVFAETYILSEDFDGLMGKFQTESHPDLY